MDATDMSYDDNFFDYVIDKGTLDAILCKDMDLIGEKQADRDAAKMIKEVYRILKPGGTYFIISMVQQPNGTMYHFEQPYLDFEI